MQDQRDDGGAHAVEDRGDPRQAAEVDVERAQRSHDDEVRENERPAARPRAPEAAAEVGEPDADLDGERARERLADRDALTHFFLRHPALTAHHLALHLTHESDGTAETEEAEPQVATDAVADLHAVVRRFRLRPRILPAGECNA